jgi:hypothetical protein
MNWKKYWTCDNNLPKGDMRVGTEEELYFTVGKMFGVGLAQPDGIAWVTGKPVGNDFLNDLAEDIIDALDLSKGDTLIELCCGNGLLTKRLSGAVGRIYAFDFAEHLINMAKGCKSVDNIIYFINDAKHEFSKDLASTHSAKFLMSDALGYFSPKDLEHIISEIKNINNDFTFYLPTVPNDKSDKYSKDDQGFNGGIGRWWTTEEIIKIASDLDLEYNIRKEKFYDYRMDVLLKSR